MVSKITFVLSMKPQLRYTFYHDPNSPPLKKNPYMDPLFSIVHLWLYHATQLGTFYLHTRTIATQGPNASCGLSADSLARSIFAAYFAFISIDFDDRSTDRTQNIATVNGFNASCVGCQWVFQIDSLSRLAFIAYLAFLRKHHRQNPELRKDYFFIFRSEGHGSRSLSGQKVLVGEEKTT